MVKSKKYVLKKHFEGEPKDDDFEVVEEDLPQELKDNGRIHVDSFPRSSASFFFKQRSLLRLFI